MKNTNAIKLNVLFLFATILLTASATMSQRSGNLRKETVAASAIYDRRPFDFADEYYMKKGVWPERIIGRRDGIDGWSVFDKASEERHRDIRLTATMPAYGPTGEILFWNPYGELTRESFIKEESGEAAMQAAARFPVFFFPSATARGNERQAALIEVGEGYSEKNPLGIGLAISVEYTSEIMTDGGRRLMEELGKRNGLSLDGTPILRTAKEIYEMTRLGMVKQRVRGNEGTAGSPYVVAKVISDPTLGAITPDAFLIYVAGRDGRPLEAENGFKETFDCLQLSGQICR